MNSNNPIKTTDFNGVQYVALTEGLRQVGGDVDWNNDTKRATVTSGTRTAIVGMADNNVTVDGQVIALSAPPLVKNDTLYVPTDFFANVFGQQIYLA